MHEVRRSAERRTLWRQVVFPRSGAHSTAPVMQAPDPTCMCAAYACTRSEPHAQARRFSASCRWCTRRSATLSTLARVSRASRTRGTINKEAVVVFRASGRALRAIYWRKVKMRTLMPSSRFIGGVLFSGITGEDLPAAAATQFSIPKGTRFTATGAMLDRSFSVSRASLTTLTGISLVLHPWNPNVPTIRAPSQSRDCALTRRLRRHECALL